MTDFSVIKKLFNIKNGIGCSEDEINEAIKKFGNLPEVLIDYYKELGREKSLNNTQDFLLLPHEIREVGEYLVFYQENQCVCQWCIAKSDLSKKDPPVYYSYDEKEFGMESETLSFFLNSMAHLQGMFGLKYSLEEIGEIDENQALKIRNKYKKKDEVLEQWLCVEFYGDYDDCVIALMKNDDWYNVMYASEDKQHYDEINEFFETYIFV